MIRNSSLLEHTPRDDRRLGVFVLIIGLAVFVAYPVASEFNATSLAAPILKLVILLAGWRLLLRDPRIGKTFLVIIFADLVAHLAFYHTGIVLFALIKIDTQLTLLIGIAAILAIRTFAPGRITVYRVIGGVGIYLTVALIFTTADAALLMLSPHALQLTAIKTGSTSPHTVQTSLLYFNLTTITSVGYGDIVPIDPIARSLANLEALFGQLFPATLLARIVSLELHDRQRSRSAGDAAGAAVSCTGTPEGAPGYHTHPQGRR